MIHKSQLDNHKFLNDYLIGSIFESNSNLNLPDILLIVVIIGLSVLDLRLMICHFAQILSTRLRLFSRSLSLNFIRLIGGVQAEVHLMF